MKYMERFKLTLLFLIIWSLSAFASDPPVVSNVTAYQRTGTNYVDIFFDISDDVSPTVVVVNPIVTIDGSAIAVTAADSGDIGVTIPVGDQKHIRWNAGVDFYDNFTDNAAVIISVLDTEVKEGIDTSAVFTIDTRINKPPVDGWQVITDSGSTYNENIIIDNNGRIWCFYLRSTGTNQPIYLKVINRDGYVYKSERIVANASSFSSNEYQTIRAELNRNTDEVWLVFQGDDGMKNTGNFIIFDDTTGIKKAATTIDVEGPVYAPKMASDIDGVMWFCWHTSVSGDPAAYGAFIRYNSDGTKIDSDSTRFETAGNIINTDIAIDASERAWLVYETNTESGFKVFNSAKLFIFSNIYSTDPVPFSQRRVIYADRQNSGHWILKKNNDSSLNQLIRFDLNGNPSIPIGEVDHCSFLLNENDRIEVVRFNSFNNRHQFSEYNSIDKSVITNWSPLFGGEIFSNPVNEFVAYNRNFNTLKAYLAKTDNQTTKVKIVNVEPISIIIDLNKNGFNFGNVGIDTLAIDTLIIQNTGNANLNVTNIDISDPGFSVSETSFSLAAEQIKKVPVTFTPDAAANFFGELTITSNADNGTQIVELNGTGYEREWIISLNPNVVDFGSIPLEDQVTDSFAIKNLGTERIFIRQLIVEGERFSLTAPTDTFSVFPGDSQFVKIGFHPVAESLYTGNTYVISNADSTANEYIPQDNKRQTIMSFTDTSKVVLKGSGYIYTAPRITVNPSTVHFDTTKIGDSATKVFKVINYGNDTLTVTNIESDDIQFEIDPLDSAFSVFPNDTHTVEITFTPNTANYSKATITIISNDPEKPEFIFYADGDGFTYGDPDIYVNPSSLLFNTIRVGNSQERSFYINNSGTDNLYISNISTSSSQFIARYDSSQYEGGSPVIAPGDPVMYVYVRFQPDSAGSYTDQLVIESNDPDSAKYEIPLFGSARNSIPQILVVEPDTIVFGEVTVHQSKSRNFYIKNDGELDLAITNIISDDSHFQLDTTGSFLIGENDSMEFNVTFTPENTEHYESHIVINSNDPDAPEKNMLLTGTGKPIPPQDIYVTPTEIDFGEITTNSIATKYIWVSNRGELSLEVTNISSNKDEFTVTPTSFVVDPGQKKYVAITFNAGSATGIVNGSITINSNDPDTPETDATVAGTVRAKDPPSISTNYDETGLDFGQVALYNSEVRYLQIYNSGEQDLVIHDISIGDSQFVVAPKTFTIYPKSYQLVQINYTPVNLSNVTTNLTIYSNAENDADFDVTISGQGRPLNPPRLTVPAQSYDFGDVLIGQQKALYFSIINSGEDTLDVVIEPSDTLNFSTSLANATLESGQSIKVIVLFIPDAVKSYINRLKLTTNDPDNPLKYIFLNGNGRDLYDPQIYLSLSDSLNFGRVLTGRTEPRILSIANLGEKDLIVSSISTADDQFTLDPTDTSFTVAGAEQRYITIRFKPEESSVVTSTLTIESNDENNPQQELKLYGVGRDRAAIIAFNPDSLFFPTTLIGDSVTRKLYVKNDGEKELRVTAVIRSDRDNFWIDNDNFELASGDSSLINVKFRPVVGKSFSDTLTIKNNDPFNPEAPVFISAISRDSILQNIVTTPDNFNFGEVGIGITMIDTLTTYNSGEKTLIVNSIYTDNSVFKIDNSGFTLSGNETKKIPIAFTPTEIQQYSGTLHLENNDENVQLTLSGSGREFAPPGMVLQADTLNFGTISLDSTSFSNFVIENSGDRSLKIIAIECEASEFTLSVDTLTIPGRGRRHVQVILSPQHPGNLNSFLVIKSNAPENGTQTIFLKANVLEPANAPRIVVSPSQLDFGLVEKDSVYQKQLWLSNIGDDTLRISRLTFSDTLFFSETTTLEISPNDVAQITIRLKATVADSITGLLANLIIYSNDLIDSTLVIVLKATIQRFRGAKISVSPEHLDFGVQVLNKIAVKNLLIKNSGEDTLTLSRITSSDPQFYTEAENYFVVPNSHSYLPVYFKPVEQDSFHAELEIVSNDTTVDSLSYVTLTGIGRTIVPQQIAVTVDELNFGQLPKNRSKTIAFHIKNDGERTLEVRKIALADTTFNDQFAIDMNWLSDNLSFISPNDSSEVFITFMPDSVSNISIDLIIESNDPDRRILQIPVTAACVDYSGPVIEFSTNIIDFGEIINGGQETRSLVLKNTSEDSTLKIFTIALQDTTMDPYFSLSETVVDVEPNSAELIEITFSPDSARSYNTTLVISHNDAFSDSLISIRATGVDDRDGNFVLSGINGWNGEGHFEYTDALINGPDHAWFLKDIYVTKKPQSAKIFLAYNDEIELFINGSMVTSAFSDTVFQWNIDNLDITSYIKLGRNRIAAHVFNGVGTGGFDAVLILEYEYGNEILIRHGGYYPDDAAKWWYYTYSGQVPVLPATFNSSNWYSYSYGWEGIDTVFASWNFEQIDGDLITDNSRYKNNIKLSNVQWIDGIIGDALEFFSNQNSYVKMDANMDAIPQTIRIWIKNKNYSTRDQIILSNGRSGYYGHGLFLSSSGRIGVFYPNGKILTNFTIDQNYWNFLSAQYFQDSIRVFVNNRQDTTFYYAAQTASSRGYMFIGGNPEFTDEFDSFSGIIDEFKIVHTVSGKPKIENVVNLATDTIITGRKGEPIDLTFKLSPVPLKIHNGTLSYRKGSHINFQEKEITEQTVTDSTLSITINGEHVSVSGLLYYLKLETSYGTIAFPTDTTKLQWIPIYTTNELSPVHVDTSYRMVSIPYDLNDNSIENILEDDLSPYSPYYWRLFQWNQNDTAYIEFNDENWGQQPGLTRGHSVWIVGNQNYSFDADSGWSDITLSNFNIEIEPGWNQIANPFPFPVFWDSVLSSYEKPDIYYWNQNIADYEINGSVSILYPWEGYFVHNPHSAEFNLIIPPQIADTLNVHRDRLVPKSNMMISDEQQFLIRIEASSGNYFDKHNFIGANNNAEDQYDQYDVQEPPKIGKYVQLSIDNSVWTEKDGRYAVDLRKLRDDGYIWNLLINSQTRRKKEIINLYVENIVEVPEDFEIYLFDLDQDLAINLNEKSSYSYQNVKNSQQLKKMRIVVGTDEFVNANSDNIPLKSLCFQLFQNYPNPFNPSTMIAFDLPKRAFVEIRIFNILGQQVRNLRNKVMRGGSHQIYWDGKNDVGNPVTSGLYIINLKADRKTANKKMLIIK